MKLKLLASRQRSAALVLVVSFLATWAAGCAEPLEHGSSVGFAPADVLPSDSGIYLSNPSGGSIHHLGPSGLETVASDLPGAYGLTRRGDGALCVSHFTSDDVMTRRPAVSCLQAGVRSELIVGVGQGVHGIASSQDGMWLAAWFDTDTESRDGLLALVRDGEVVRRVELGASVPQFMATLPDGTVWLSVWYEDAAGPRNGRILRVSPDGEVEPFGPRDARPAGLAIVNDRLWFSDHRDGTLVGLDREGKEVGRHEGLEGPLGMRVTTGSTVCVAEGGGNRVTCFETSVQAYP